MTSYDPNRVWRCGHCLAVFYIPDGGYSAPSLKGECSSMVGGCGREANWQPMANPVAEQAMLTTFLLIGEWEAVDAISKDYP